MIFYSLGSFFGLLNFWTIATAEWNITMENILEKRRIKAEKNKDQNLQLFTQNI